MSDQQANTVKHGDEVYELDALLDTYKDLYNQIIEQLNKLELSDDQLERVSGLLGANTEFSQAVGYALYNKIMNNQEDPYVYLEAMAKQVFVKLADRIEAMINKATNTIIKNEYNDRMQDYVSERIATAVETRYRSDACHSERLTYALRSIMDSILDEQKLSIAGLRKRNDVLTTRLEVLQDQLEELQFQAKDNSTSQSDTANTPEPGIHEISPTAYL